MHAKAKIANRFERRAFLLGVVLLVGLGTLGFVGLAQAAQIGPNPTVQMVDNPDVSCESPMPSAEETGQFGETITVSAEAPIDFVVVKTAPNATVESTFDGNSGQITSSGSILAYVVFTCPTTAPTDTTTIAPPTTVESTTTTEAPTSTTETPTSTG